MSTQRKVFLSTILILTLLALFYVQYDFAQKEPGKTIQYLAGWALKHGYTRASALIAIL